VISGIVGPESKASARECRGQLVDVQLVDRNLNVDDVFRGEHGNGSGVNVVDAQCQVAQFRA